MNFYVYWGISFPEVNGLVTLIRKDPDMFLDGMISKVTSCDITSHDMLSPEKYFNLIR